jgi:hypothetical protein
MKMLVFLAVLLALAAEGIALPAPGTFSTWSRSLVVPTAAPVPHSATGLRNSHGYRKTAPLLRGIFLMVFVLVSVIFVASLLMAARRLFLPPSGKRRPSRYVDAWKIAGQRMDEPPEPPEES